MRACWAATLLVLVQPSRATCATCLGTSVVPRVLALTHRHPHKSPCIQKPFVAISGSIAFSSLWFLSRKLCPIFVCQFKGSLHFAMNLQPNTRQQLCRHSSPTAGIGTRGEVRMSLRVRAAGHSELYPKCLPVCCGTRSQHWHSPSCR